MTRSIRIALIAFPFALGTANAEDPSPPGGVHTSARTDVHARFEKHPVEDSRGNAYGYEPRVDEGDGRVVDHVCLPAGGRTRIVLRMAGIEDTGRITLSSTPGFTARLDSCTRGRCVVEIQGIAQTRKDPAGSGHGGLLKVEARGSRSALDSIRVHVLPSGRVGVRLVQIQVAGRRQRGIDRASVARTLRASLKYLGRDSHLEFLPTRTLPSDWFGSKFGFIPVLQNGPDEGAYAAGLDQAVAGTGAGVGVLGLPFWWAWKLRGPLRPGENDVDPDNLNSVKWTADRVDAPARVLEAATGRSWPVVMRRGGSGDWLFAEYSGPAVDTTSGGDWLLYFDRGDRPQGIHGLFQGVSVIELTLDGLEGDASRWVGDILAHETGHRLGLGDVDNPANRMNLSLNWSADIPTPFSISPQRGVRTGTRETDPLHPSWRQWEEAK